MASRQVCAALALLVQCACSADANSLFRAELNARDSATAVLQSRCAVPITAAPVRGQDAPPPPDIAGLGPEPGYRHVRLSCGNSIRSEAHNWYARHRLTPDMNRLLDQTDTPFGKVVSPLGFRRIRLSETRGPGPGCPPATVLTHRAKLVLPGGQPLALLVECYTRANTSR